MKKLGFILAITLVGVFALSCKDDIPEYQNNGSKEISTKSIPLNNIANYKGDIPGDTLQKPVLPSQNEYLYNITDSQTLMNFIHMGDSSGHIPMVDFSKETVLVAVGYSNSGIVKIEKKFNRESAKKYLLTVDITKNTTSVVERWGVAMIIPKIEDDATVNLKVNYK